MSTDALERGAAEARLLARLLAMVVFNPSHTADLLAGLEIEERLNALANALEDAARRLRPEGGATNTNRGGAKTGCALLDASREEQRVTRNLVEKWAGSDVVDKEAALELVPVDGLNFLFAAGLLRWHCGAIWLTDKHRELWAEVVKERSIRAIVEVQTMGGDRG